MSGDRWHESAQERCSNSPCRKVTFRSNSAEWGSLGPNDKVEKSNGLVVLIVDNMYKIVKDRPQLLGKQPAVARQRLL